MVEKDEIKIVGLKIRTKNEIEINSTTSNISILVNHYWKNKLAESIEHRVMPNKSYSIYTEYESDETGEYSYFIGEEVSDFNGQDLETFSCLTIPKQHYQRFTTKQGKIPSIALDAWQEIWAMSNEALGGQRTYQADFEI